MCEGEVEGQMHHIAVDCAKKGRDRQTDRDRQAAKETDKETESRSERQREDETQTQTQTDRHGETDRDRQREVVTSMKISVTIERGHPKLNEIAFSCSSTSIGSCCLL